MPFNAIDTETLHQKLSAGSAVLIDVREASEHAAGNIPGAINIPIGSLSVDTLPDHAGKMLVLHCGGGGRSSRACEALLAQHPSLVVYNLIGGFRGWKAANLSTQGSGGTPEGHFCELRKKT